jgi:hypothetical protein
MAQSGRRLTARPVESQQPGAEINYIQKQHCMSKQPFKKACTKKCFESKKEFKIRQWFNKADQVPF